MKCTKCTKKAIFLKPTLCKKHFCAYVETKVDKTIKKFKLITPRDKVVVGVSGGKDSLTVLYLLRKYTKNIIALCINEGIEGYRDTTIEDMKRFCTEHGIKYVITSYKEEFGLTLDEMLTKINEKPCTVCGAFRRYLLNKKARELGATKLVTGHNLDDESQAVMMNLLRHQTTILPRLGPISGITKDKKFVPRIKPLYYLTEKETAAYSFLMQFGIKYTVCPNATQAYRGEIGNFLNTIEQEHPGTKERLLTRFTKQLPAIRKKVKQTATTSPMQYCNMCNEPCMQHTCKPCQYLIKLGVASA